MWLLLMRFIGRRHKYENYPTSLSLSYWHHAGTGGVYDGTRFANHNHSAWREQKPIRLSNGLRCLPTQYEVDAGKLNVPFIAAELQRRLRAMYVHSRERGTRGVSSAPCRPTASALVAPVRSTAGESRVRTSELTSVADPCA